jgi:hypothetical protein
MRLGAISAAGLVPLIAAFLLGNLPAHGTWIDAALRLGLIAAAVAAVAVGSRLSLGFLADHPAAVEENLRLTGRRKRSGGSLPELRVTAWGQEAWIAVVATEARLEEAIRISGQTVAAV